MSKTKILFVDDNNLNRMVMEEMIDIIFPEITIESYESASEVLNLPLEEYIMILSDISMPDIDGFTLYDRLRTQKNYQKPIIAVTALAVGGDKERMLMHGFSDFISKPIDMNELENTLSKYILKED